DGGIVCNLPIEIGRGQRGMAEPAHFDHRLPPDRWRRLARAKVASRDAVRGIVARVLALMVMRNYASLSYSNRANRLECQTGVHGNFDPQRLSGALGNRANAVTGQMATRMARPVFHEQMRHLQAAKKAGSAVEPAAPTEMAARREGLMQLQAKRR